MLSHHARVILHPGHSLRGGSFLGTPRTVRSHMAAAKDPRHAPRAPPPRITARDAGSGGGTSGGF